MVIVGTTSALVSVLVCLVGGIALYQLNSARSELFDHLDPALLEAQQLALSLVNQETGVRGYAATSDPTFLAPYQEGAAQESAALMALRRLATAPIVAQVVNLAPVAGAAARWHDSFASPTLEAVRSGRSTSGPTLALGKSLFDTLRHQLDQQRAGLTSARTQARETVDGAYSRLLWTGVGSVVGILAVLTALVVGTQRSIIAPIAGLAYTVRSVAAGRYERPVGVAEAAAPQEIVSLATDVESMRTRVVTELNAMSSLNEQLSAQSQRLARSNRDLEQFAYVASHDLQEPLRKVTGFCQLLADRYRDQLDERAGTYIGYAVDGAQRMSALINDLLMFSRVGRGKINAAPLAGRALLDEALANLEPTIANTGAAFTIGDLPEVLGQRTLLVTLFQNLVGNALKFRGDHTPEVDISAEPNGITWLFRVHDNGIGIDQAYAEKIFVIFQRLHSKTDYPGTGIGLALCRRIVEYHGGQIWLDQADQTASGNAGDTSVKPTGAGTTFAFTLPAASAPAL
jgi:signal transduction histidine kinase